MINQVVPNSVQKGTFSDFSQPKNGWYLAEHPSEEEKRKSHKLAYTIAFSTLIFGFCIFALFRGSISRYLTPYLEKLQAKLDNKIAKNTNLKGVYQKISNFVGASISSLQTLNNYTSLKDMLFQKLMYKTNPTKKLHKYITKIFNNMSRSTVNSSYAGTNKQFANLNEYLLRINAGILDKSPEKAGNIASIKAKISAVNAKYDEGFGLQARANRVESIENETNNIFQDVWEKFGNLDNFRTRNMYQTFIAEERMKPFKTKMIESVTSSKKGIKEELDGILEKYKDILSKKEYKNLEQKVQSALNSLDKSIEIETGKYIDKARDLKLGAAPTDILSIIMTIIPVGWFLGKANDKEERISSTLKYGIPVIGAITTSLICTGKLISGGKARAIALVSGWIMNRIGTSVDETRKKYKVDISLQKKNASKPQSDKVSTK